MSKPRILHIETATHICSVALSEGEQLLALRESDEDKSHGSLLTVFMDEVLKEAALHPTDLHAISVSIGPGSYTGLRIGVSATKGFAYALKIPIIGIDTLLALAAGVKSSEAYLKIRQQHPDLLMCPMLDARRMEAYAGFYNADNTIFRKISADILDENSYKEILDAHPVLFFGNGSQKLREVIQHSNALFLNDIVPSAENMIPLSVEAFNKKKFQDSAYFEPYYLKDFVATIPRKKVL